MIVVEAEPFPLGQHAPIGQADVVEEAWEADAAEPRGEMHGQPRPQPTMDVPVLHYGRRQYPP